MAHSSCFDQVFATFDSPYWCGSDPLRFNISVDLDFDLRVSRPRFHCEASLSARWTARIW